MRHLLKTPDSTAREALECALAATRGVFPMKTAHRKALPLAVSELSLLLTAERGQSQGYWQKPALIGAYLYYFLPWNLLRLAWLLPNLNIDLPPQSRVLDLGSGPLTLPLGLWLFKPELQKAALSLTCADPAQRPMELGRGILDSLSESAWQTSLMRAPIEVALRKAGRVRLISAGNVLNELPARQESLEERLENIFYSMDRALEDGGQIFLMEPGTRLGGKLIALMRRIAVEEGYLVEAPCTHAAACPYAPPVTEDNERGRAGQRAGQPSGWCHFSLTADGAPGELLALSREAGLEKERLSLSCLLLRKPGGQSQRPAQHDKAAPRQLGSGLITPVRVISDEIRLPQAGSARYVCSGHGLGLLAPAEGCKSGMLAEAFLPDKGARDAKSGAWLMRPARQQEPRQAPGERQARPEPGAQTRPARPKSQERPARTPKRGSGKAPAAGQKKSRPRAGSGKAF